MTVADTDGGRKSVSFELHVIGILITTQPQSQTVSVGANVILTVGVAGPAPFNYQWQRNGLPISGATSSILVLSNVQRADAGEYKVAVSNETGAVLSAAATLTILSIGPENDAFINRIPLTGMSVIAEGSNIDATNESDEPKHDGLHLATAWVWWSWKASKYGDVRISTTGSSIDTLEAMHNNMNNY